MMDSDSDAAYVEGWQPTLGTLWFEVGYAWGELVGALERLWAALWALAKEWLGW